MPSTDTTPADGVSTSAAAQVLNRRVLIIRSAANYLRFGGGGFSPGSGGTSTELRDITITQVNNLPKLYINLYLFPEYDDGLVVYSARTVIQWRPVFQMPPAPALPSGFDMPGIVSGEWLPLAAPMILPVAVPIVYAFNGAGIEQVAIEIRLDQEELGDEPVVGQDRVMFSISASS
jgi:hypothetical protein